MPTIFFLPILFIIIYIILLSIVNEIPKFFIARFALILFLGFASIFHLKYAINMTDLTPGASELLRNTTYFTGLFQIALAVGLFFTKSLKWTSIVLIAFLALLILLNLFGVFTEYGFIDKRNLEESILWKMLDYFGLIGWTYLFGIHFAGNKGIVGWNDKKD